MGGSLSLVSSAICIQVVLEELLHLGLPGLRQIQEKVGLGWKSQRREAAFSSCPPHEERKRAHRWCSVCAHSLSHFTPLGLVRSQSLSQTPDSCTQPSAAAQTDLLLPLRSTISSVLTELEPLML